MDFTKGLSKKSTVAFTLTVLLSFSFVGCNKKLYITPESPSQAKTINQAVSPLFITKDEFYQAIGKLNPEFSNDARIKEAFELKNPNISQLLIGVGTQYLVGWVEDLGFNSVLVIFRLEGAKRIPIYFDTPSNRIISVKSLPRYTENVNFVEITGYNASGSYNNQRVKLLLLNGDNIKTVWQHNIVENDSHADISDGETIFNRYYSPHILMVDEQRNPTIIINETSEKFTQNNNVVEGKDKKIKQRLFIWNNNEEKFIEKE